jgi:hypothetical protein
MTLSSRPVPCSLRVRNRSRKRALLLAFVAAARAESWFAGLAARARVAKAKGCDGFCRGLLLELFVGWNCSVEVEKMFSFCDSLPGWVGQEMLEAALALWRGEDCEFGCVV